MRNQKPTLKSDASHPQIIYRNYLGHDNKQPGGLTFN